MGIMISLQGIGAFLLYFAVALTALGVFLAVYMAITSHNEMALIRQGNAAAATSLAGAVLGFILPLASTVIHSVSLVDMVVWAAVALVVQVAVFWIVGLLLRDLSRRIEEGNAAAGITLAAASVAIGAINAACISY
ncbi:MAG: DUF350 domain-containing protein [Alphaproteobacteria bacterium]|nr:DUF350 domain-containing protein [Alphaproteobacteria bacterium]